MAYPPSIVHANDHLTSSLYPCSEDLLDTAAGVRSPDMTRLAVDRTYGMLKVPLSTPTLATLSKRSAECYNAI
jgi:hypothetical protein